ncbi:hypothetical protein OEA41_005402 [Lepraria neglecta]|uniref:Uncharacterized protein n=1 Tax=Lepraria neglecta TaxID=209136 RepID=A0AAE0DGR4_9LECA|nr:hypothetical protein OEA41_005402 [Lepraria neglecta]
MSKKTPTELLTEIRPLKEQIEKLKMEAGEDAREFRALQRKYNALEQRSVGLEAELKSKAAEIANKDAIISQLEVDRQVAADISSPGTNRRSALTLKIHQAERKKESDDIQNLKAENATLRKDLEEGAFEKFHEDFEKGQLNMIALDSACKHVLKYAERPLLPLPEQALRREGSDQPRAQGREQKESSFTETYDSRNDYEAKKEAVLEWTRERNEAEEAAKAEAQCPRRRHQSLPRPHLRQSQ